MVRESKQLSCKREKLEMLNILECARSACKVFGDATQSSLIIVRVRRDFESDIDIEY